MGFVRAPHPPPPERKHHTPEHVEELAEQLLTTVRKSLDRTPREQDVPLILEAMGMASGAVAGSLTHSFPVGDHAEAQYRMTGLLMAAFRTNFRATLRYYRAATRAYMRR